MPGIALERPSIASVRSRLATSGWVVSDGELEDLLADERAGIRALGARVLAHRARVRAEEDRLRRMVGFEEERWGRGETTVAGVDEAGRGPLAGPVVAAAVVLWPGLLLHGVDDSKRLSPGRRERLLPMIRANSRGVGVGVVWQDVIDRENIREATFRAMRKALGRLRLEPQFVLVDGDEIPGLALRQRGIRGGDRRSLTIAAASIVAKVVRDRIMMVLDRRYPGYGFGRHKGYGTEAHRDAIARFGLSSVHRRTFCST